LSRDADEICNESLLRRDSVDGQYVAQLFKWIKQHLRIRHFYETSEHAVKTQIWTAVCVYVLAVSVHSFEKIPISQAFSDSAPACATELLPNQLNLFDS